MGIKFKQFIRKAPLLVSVSGLPGSGKTTISNKLKEFLNDNQIKS